MTRHAAAEQEAKTSQVGGPSESKHSDETIESPTIDRWQQLRSYGYSIGEHHLLVEQSSYCELLSQPRVAPLPNAPPHFLGLTNVRGNLVPVYQLEPLLGIPAEKPPYALLVGKPTAAAALAIQHKPLQFDLANLSRGDTPEGLPELLLSVLTGTHIDNADLWLTINHEQLFRYLANAQ